MSLGDLTDFFDGDGEAVDRLSSTGSTFITGKVSNPLVVTSLNVPVPGTVRQIASSLAPDLTEFDTIREQHTLVVKRFETDYYDEVASEVRRTLRGLDPFDATVTGLDLFIEPITGPAPVLYLAVDSQVLRMLHDELVSRFGVIEGLEGPNYIPHITLARGGDTDLADRFATHQVEPVTWTVTELEFWNPRYNERVSRIQLPIQ